MSEPAHKNSPRYMLLLSLGALGVVYGDIGTSPLYAFREAFHAAEGLAVTRGHVIGILSLIFWALVVVVSIKYLAVVLRADNEGEGGILALTALLLPANRRYHLATARRALIAIGLFGTALLYGDGIITPAISVLSAVEGLRIVAPALGAWVVPIASVILVGLFAIQRTGTGRVGAVFGPVMIVWFVVLALLGLGRIIADPSVLAAVNPAHAVGFIAERPRLSFLALGGIFLVVTGSEALYADMGHFGRGPIRIGWFAVVFPSLLLNYFGQGALLIASPEVLDNPFYRMAPGWALFPMVLLSTAATVIASQALISGAYSLTMQAAQLGYLPRMRIDHTSPREIGQIYVPAINWALMVACIGLVVSFRSSSGLAAAYGVAVTTTMVITTILLYRVARERWRWGRAGAGALLGVFLLVDLAFFAANIIKVPAGGWFPLVVGLLVYWTMTTWRWGRDRILAGVVKEVPVERFIASLAQHPQRRVPGTGVYMVREAGYPPPALVANLRHNGVIHETVILVTVRTAAVARVHRARRATIHEMGEGFFQVVLLYGFTEKPDVPRALSEIVVAGFGFDPEDATYFLGRETVAPAATGPVGMRGRLFALMHRNASSAAELFSLPRGRLVEIGSQIEI